MHELPAHSTERLFGALRFSGPQARDFLQGQLSQDLRLLTAERPLLAAHNTPQGRVVAVLRLFADNDDILGLVPASMTESLAARLRKYVLRTKVTIADASADLAHLEQTIPAAAVTALHANAWRLSQIAAGQPQIYPQTAELFVAQMLNLDLIDGISFSKGCYTGQEIIARTHYRGSIKRRMLRFQADDAGGFEYGATVGVDRGRSGRIVEWAATADGRVEFLAVVNLQTSESNPAETPLLLSGVSALELPYRIPEIEDASPRSG